MTLIGEINTPILERTATMNKSPAFQFYPEKWVAHTMHLSPEAYQLYHRMLCWMWMHSPDQCSMGMDPDAISLALNLRDSRTGIAAGLKEIQNPFNPLFIEQDGRYISHGLFKTLETQKHYQSLSAEGNKARWPKKLQPIPCGSPVRDTKSYPTKDSSPSPSPSPNYNPPNPPKGKCAKPPRKRKRPSELTQAQLDAFERFWSVYPRHEARDDAEKAWKKIPDDPALWEKIIAAAIRYQDVEAIKAHGSRWLNAKRWEDEPYEEPERGPGGRVPPGQGITPGGIMDGLLDRAKT